MERPTFFRAADDLDLMAPLSNLSDDDLAPCAARSMALMAKKRGLAQKQPEAPKPARSGRQLWADITTDDEDNFPAWPPAPKAAPVTTAPEVKISETKGDELLWDPIGLGSSESYLTDLLYHKTQTKTSGAGTVFDKWSWSTAATDSPDSTLEDFQADDEDQTPQVEAVQSVQMPVGRSNALHGWMPLPPPLRTETPKTRDERSESWLKWWSHEEGDGLDRREAFFQNLPPNKLTLMEMELRDAIIDFLEQRKSEDSPTWDEIRVQPMVVECTKKALPHFVSLEEWLHRRQRLSNHGIITWPPPPPLWRLEPTERWKKDLPPEPSPEAHTKFQRRDSTQRRGSSVFGVNFQVTDHGQIFGVLAGDEEAVCELPWPCSSVVPEQKNFGWIKSSGARGCLPSVATHGNMTVEDVMAWRLSHRFRQRRVEPVLQSMWQALAKQRLPKTCKCEHCRGTLQYEITLASSE